VAGRRFVGLQKQAWAQAVECRLVVSCSGVACRPFAEFEMEVGEVAPCRVSDLSDLVSGSDPVAHRDEQAGEVGIE